MKVVFVRPERCVGCRQCELACAVAHSSSQTLGGAVLARRKPLARIHVGAGRFAQPFPNRCRHCDPAPCQASCPTEAIYRDPATGSVLVDVQRCICCASCAMACPFGVIRFHAEPRSSSERLFAYKCDNCVERRQEGEIPACVEVCKTGALAFEELNTLLAAKTREVAKAATFGITIDSVGEPGAMDRLRALRIRLASL